jgi:hypothetical protein
VIVNRPTGVKLESLFPEQSSTHNVVGGEVLSPMPGLALVIVYRERMVQAPGYA